MSIRRAVGSLFLLLFVTAIPVFAQQGAQRAPGGVQVAVVDVALIFEKHPNFKRQMDQMKAEVESFEKEMLAQRKNIAGQQTRLTEFHVGSREYKEADAAITQEMSDLQVRAQLKKKDLMLREAKVYYDSYNEIYREVEAVAARYKISMVVRYNSKEIDAQDPNSVRNGINRFVVYQKGLDITNMVLESIEARHNRAARRN